MSDDLVLYQPDDQNGHVVTITLNQPDTRNAISELAMVDAVVDAIDRLQADTQARVGILTGAGTAFSSGGNVKKLRAELTDSDLNPCQIEDFYRLGIQRIPLAIHKLDVPLIAAVNGPAIGAGCDLTTMCDIRIAGERAKFAESFVRLGIIPGDGGAYFLPRVVGMSKAAEMTFTGEALNAEEALACGLVSRVVADDELMSAARDLADRIAANPPRSVRMAKRLLRDGQKLPLASFLEMSASYQALAHRTDDHREAMAAVFEKRDGDYKGS